MTKAIYLLLLVAVSCKTGPDEEQIDFVKANTWQWDSGFKIGEGDFVSFDAGSKVFTLQADTIYYKNQPRVCLKNVNIKNNEIVISSLNGKKGKYVNIEEFTK